MTWDEANRMIQLNIKSGTKLDNRTVLDGPDYNCIGYNYNAEPGYKIQIGAKTSIEIPFSMLKDLFIKSTRNYGIYENKTFKDNFERQLKNHPCHVHVVGRIFEKAGIAIQISKRQYKLL